MDGRKKAVLAKEGQLNLGKRGGYAGEGGEGGLLGRRECSPREEGKILTGEGGKFPPGKEGQHF